MNKDQLDKSNLEQLGLLAEVFNIDRIVTPAEVEQVLVGILKMINQNKKENQNLNAEVQASLTKALTQIINERNSIIARVEGIKDGIESDVHTQIDSSNKKIEKLFAEIKLLMPENGKDADEEYIIDEVLKRVKLPEYKEVMLDDGEQIADKLEALTGDKRLDASAIKNLPTGGGWKGGGSRYLQYLADVKITDLTDGDAIVWDTTTGTFINSAVAGGGVDTANTPNANEFARFTDADTIEGRTTAETLTDLGFTASITELNYTDGVTSAIQTQLNGKQASMGADDNYVTDAQLVVIGNTSGTNTGDQDISGKADKSGALTQFVGNTAFRVFYSDTNGDITELALGADGTFLKSNGAGVAPSFATPAGSGDVSKVGTPVNNQVGVWTGDGTLEGDAALTYDATTDTLTSVTFAGNLTGNVTGTASGNLTSANIVATITNGVTTNAPSEDAVFDALALKAPLTSPTFATSVTGSYLTASEMLITDASKNIVSAAVATYPSLTELTYVKGVTSAIQTQLGTKQATITFGTGVQTALGVNIGSAGSPVLFDGALGTPSSGTVTNLTGTASININGTVGATTPTTIVGTTIQANTGFVPDADGGAYLGTTALGFSGLFLDTLATINIDNSNWVATHTSGILTVGTGDLRVTTAGTNTASVVTVGGTQTLTAKTLTSPTLTTPSAFTTGGTITLAENTSIALDPAGSADGKYSGITVAGTAGATLAFGDLIYLDPTDSRWELADANAAAAADGDSRGILGICVLAAAGDASATTILLQGIVRADTAFPALTINAPVYVSETAGDIVVTQPTTTDVVIRVVGFAITADEIYFNPSPDYITHT